MLNRVVIMGRLVKDPEQRVTSTNKAVCSFCVAVDSKKETADFIDVIAWEKTAEFVCKYFHKGSTIAVDGRIATRNWEDKNGNKRKAVEIVADNISFCGGKSESETYTPSPAITPPTDEEYRDIPEDDLPF